MSRPLLPTIYQAKGVVGAPKGYSAGRKHARRMGMKMSRAQDLEMPEKMCRLLGVEGRELDNSHHPGTFVGKCLKGWYDPKTRSQTVLFQAYDDEDGRAVARNIENGVLRDISLSTITEYAKPHDYVLDDYTNREAIAAHAKQCIEEPASVTVFRVALCWKGARPGTSIVKQNPAEIHPSTLTASEACIGSDEHGAIPYENDPSALHLNDGCCCHLVTMAANNTPPSTSEPAAAASPSAPQDAPAQPAAAAPAPQPASTPAPAPSVDDNAAVTAAIGKSNLYAMEKKALNDILRGEKMSPESAATLQRLVQGSNLPRDLKADLTRRLAEMIPPKPTAAAETAAPMETSTPEVDPDAMLSATENDGREPIDRALETIVSHIAKDDTASKKMVFHTMLPLKDMLLSAGVRIGDQKPTVALLGGLAKANATTFATDIKKLYTDALEAQNQRHMAVSQASATAGSDNSAPAFTLACATEDELQRAERYLAARRVNTPKRVPASSSVQMASDDNKTNESSLTFAASGGRGGGGAAPRTALPAAARQQQARARKIFELDQDADTQMAREMARRQTVSTLQYAKASGEEVQKLKGTPVRAFSPFTGQLTVQNGVLDQLCSGPKFYTTPPVVGPVMLDMMQRMALRSRTQSTRYTSIGRKGAGGAVDDVDLRGASGVHGGGSGGGSSSGMSGLAAMLAVR